MATALDQNGNPILDANGQPVRHGVVLLPIEFVTDDGNGGFAQQTFTYNGTATPVIDASSSSASIDANGNISATIAGTVTDQTSDCTPTASKQVQSLTVQAGSSSNQVNLTNSGTPDPTNPWHPYKYLANYSQNVSFTVNGPGQYPIELTTSLNAAGMAGDLELVANVTPKVNQKTYNIVLPSNFSPTGTNQITFYEGASDPSIGNETLTETGPGTNVFTGQLFFANVTVMINTFAGLTSNIDQLEATVVLIYSNGETKQTDVQFAETGAITDTFSAQVPEETDGIDLGGLLNLTLPSSFSMTSPDMVQTFVGNASPSQGPFILTEDANNSLSFVGTTSWAQARAQIMGFTGLTSGVDTITVNWTFIYPDGHQVTLRSYP